MNKTNHTDFLLEDMNGKFDLLIETVGQIREEVKSAAKQSDLEEIKADIKVVKAVMTDISQHVAKHEEQITDLKVA